MLLRGRPEGMDGMALVPDPGDRRRWRLTGTEPDLVSAMNAYLGYLADRNYSPRTVRAYGYGLLAFCAVSSRRPVCPSML